VPLSWSELARRTWREVIDDDVLGLAAQLSYYFFLALFPAILFLLAVASFFPLSNITDDVGRSLGPFGADDRRNEYPVYPISSRLNQGLSVCIFPSSGSVPVSQPFMSSYRTTGCGLLTSRNTAP
jgi:Virulence factor BrkB